MKQEVTNEEKIVHVKFINNTDILCTSLSIINLCKSVSVCLADGSLTKEDVEPVDIFNGLETVKSLLNHLYEEIS